MLDSGGPQRFYDKSPFSTDQIMQTILDNTLSHQLPVYKYHSDPIGLESSVGTWFRAEMHASVKPVTLNASDAPSIFQMQGVKSSFGYYPLLPSVYLSADASFLQMGNLEQEGWTLMPVQFKLLNMGLGVELNGGKADVFVEGYASLVDFAISPCIYAYCEDGMCKGNALDMGASIGVYGVYHMGTNPSWLLGMYSSGDALQENLSVDGFVLGVYRYGQLKGVVYTEPGATGHRGLVGYPLQVGIDTTNAVMNYPFEALECISRANENGDRWAQDCMLANSLGSKWQDFTFGIPIKGVVYSINTQYQVMITMRDFVYEAGEIAGNLLYEGAKLTQETVYDIAVVSMEYGQGMVDSMRIACERDEKWTIDSMFKQAQQEGVVLKDRNDPLFAAYRKNNVVKELSLFSRTSCGRYITSSMAF